MSAYLLSFSGAALLAALVGVLAPGSAGLKKHLRLISILVLLCILAVPLPGLITKLKDLPSLSSEGQPEFDFEARAKETLDSASRVYFVRALTTHLEEKFGIAPGEIRCAVVWKEEGSEARPERVTLIFSGSAKWKNPHEPEAYVSELLGCPCNSAVD